MFSSARSSLYKLFLALSAGMLLLLAIPLSASAHAQYDHSNPTKNARLPAGQVPATVEVWFTEQIEPSFSKLEVYDRDRQRVDKNDSHMVTNDPSALTISLRSNLPDGPYTVVFRNVSQQDGHEVEGSFTFVVGSGPLPAPTTTFPAENQSTTENLSVWSVSLRWLNYLGMAGLFGALAFFLLAWRPGAIQVQERIGPELTVARQRIQKHIVNFVLGSLLLLVVGWLAMLFYQTTVVSGSALWQVFGNGALQTLLLKTHFGTIWILRLVLLLLAFCVWLLVRGQNQRELSMTTSYYWLLVLIALALMVTTSLNSHAAASASSWLLLPLDVLHLASTGFWIGGLLALTVLLPVALHALVPGTGDRTRLLAALLPRFSLIAIISVLLLTITGTIQAAVQLNTLNALFDNLYGQTLVIKLVLFLALLVLGAYNLLRISPHMRAFASSSDEKQGASSLGAGALQRRFQRSVRFEVLLATILLVIVGVLTSLSPPPQASARSGFIYQGRSADLTYSLAINPFKVGDNTFELALKTQDGRPMQKADAILLRFTMLDMDMGVQQIELTPLPNTPGVFATNDSALSMVGNWEGTLLIRRPGFDDVKVSFPLQIQGASTQ